MPLDFSTIAATTLKNYRRTLTDNIFDGHPLLFWLKEKKRVRMLDGGENIVEPLLYSAGDLGTATGSYSNYDAISINPVETATAAKYDWKQIAGTIAISGLEELKNNGESAIVNLLEAKILQAEETLSDALAGMLWSSAIPANSLKDVTGLGVLIGDATTDTAASILAAHTGGISSTDYSWWRSHTANKTATAAGDVDLRAFVRNAYNTASRGGKDKVDAVFSGQLAYEQYEADLLPSVRRTNTKVADAGFDNLEVQGVPWMWDHEAPASTVYGISSKYLGLVGHSARWFKQSKFTEGLSAADGGVATTVDARYSIITAALELTCRNRRRHFRIYNINGV
jgi:hypothetical protein